MQAAPSSTRMLRPNRTHSSHTAWQSSGGSHGHAAPSAHSFHGTPWPSSLPALSQLLQGACSSPQAPASCSLNATGSLRTRPAPAMASPSSGVQKLVVMESPAKGVGGLDNYTQSEPRWGRGGLGSGQEGEGALRSQPGGWLTSPDLTLRRSVTWDRPLTFWKPRSQSRSDLLLEAAMKAE